MGLLYLPQYLPVGRPAPIAYAAEPDNDVIYYEVPVVHKERQVPQIAPPGDAGRPGEGLKAEETPTKGSTVSLGDLTVVSKPLQPDNHRQTIIQPLSPPDMRITQDVKLPNVIMGNLAAPRAPLTFSAQDMPKPVQRASQTAASAAPNIADPTRSNPLPATANDPSIAKPLPTLEALKPIQQARGNGIAPPVAPAPSLTDLTRGNGLPVTAGDPTIAKPQLPMGIAKPVQQARGNGGPNSPAPAPNLADPTRGDASTLIAANEPTVQKPALPVVLQKPNQQGRGGNGQGLQGGPGGVAAAPNVAEPSRGSGAPGAASFGGGGPAAPLPHVPAMPRPIQQGGTGIGQGSQGVLTAAAPNVAEPTRGVGAGNFGGSGLAAAPAPQVSGLQRPVQQARAGNGAGGGQNSQGADGAPVLSDAKGLMIIGVDPSPAGSQIAVPPGNRWGDFTIAPAKGPGSPGGTPAGGTTAAGSTGQTGSGGDRSIGIGTSGTGGGGGPTSASLGPISVKGTLPGAGDPLLLTGSVAAEMVYPLPIAVVSKLRQNRMIVSAGSIGGGGLNVYGALACSKIYTIFMPMPGANWTMQFCQKSSDTASQKPQTPNQVIQLAPPLVPPDPNEDNRFDFKRLPVPPEKTQNKTIVLKGTLDEEGSVQNLQVYQGVLPEMDQAAQLAFSRWKFKPAMQSNKPVSVEILVGIPAQTAPAVSSASGTSQPASGK